MEALCKKYFDVWKARKELGEHRKINHLKIGIWLYFLLLVFEGALRKWILPGLSSPLLLIRDPLAIWLLIESLKKGYLNNNIYIILIYIVTVIAFFTAIIFGHGNFMVAIFGARIFLIQFPIIFTISKVFNREDVLKMGRWILYLSIPMVILIILQFYSPQSAWVNRGVGGDESGAGFDGALGYFRPPGTFSFTNGNGLFFAFTGVFVYYFWMDTKQINHIALILSTIALILSLFFSISRTLLFSNIIFLFFALVALSKTTRGLVSILGFFLGLSILFGLVSQFSFVQTAITVFTARFTSASKSEGGLQGTLLDRYLGGMLEALNSNVTLPYWGHGLGMGTNVGSALLTGKRQFLISEGEWGRLIGEMGFLLGLIVILTRLLLSLQIAIKAYSAMRTKNYLPWMLLGMVLLTLPQGQWAQATFLGFAVLLSGLCLASMNYEK